jgi:adenylosuccinate synthase
MVKQQQESNITVVVGAQWGDEGKGKVTDSLKYGLGIRYNGGANAGANITKDGKHVVLHAVPAAALDQNKTAYVGSGCVLNPTKFLEELEDIVKAGFDNPTNLTISPYTTLIQPSHLLLDGLMGGKVGTTGNGIGPAYASRAQRQLGDLRKNIRLADYLQDPNKYKQFVMQDLNELLRVYPDFKDKKINVNQLANQFDESVKQLEGYLQKDPLYMTKLFEQGNNFLLQGANSVMLDVATGPIPYVTSSRTLAGAAMMGSDLPPHSIDTVIGVAKVIMSRVGNGPFISEYGQKASENYCSEEGGYKHMKQAEFDSNDLGFLLSQGYDINNLLEDPNSLDLGKALRMMGGEYGATTKRPRRIGALDLVQLKHAARQNRMDYLFLTKVDLLDHFDKANLPGIPVVTKYELDGQEIDYVPATSEEQRRVKATVEYLPHVKDYNNKDEVNTFIKAVEEKVGVQVCGYGTGPQDHEKVMLVDL